MNNEITEEERLTLEVATQHIKIAELEGMLASTRAELFAVKRQLVVNALATKYELDPNKDRLEHRTIKRAAEANGTPEAQA